MKELKNIDVHLISLVDKGANKRQVICKGAGVKEDDKFTLRKEVKITKVDEEKHLVYGVVYAPNDEDAHGDFATVEEIEKACHNFLAKSNTSKAVDTQHNLEPVEGVTIVECAIIKGEHSILKGEPDGTWFIVTKIENEEIWKSVKDGTYTGYSLYGFAERAGEAKSEKAKGKKFSSLMQRIEKWFDEEEGQAESNEVVKSFDDVYRRMQLRTMADALSSAVWEVISDSNMKKLQAAMDAMQSLMDSAGTAESKRAEINKQIKNKTTMDTITKEAHDKAIEDLKKEQADALKKVQDELAETKEKLEKASPGSQQVDDTKPETEVVKKSLPFLS